MDSFVDHVAAGQMLLTFSLFKTKLAAINLSTMTFLPLPQTCYKDVDLAVQL